mmetsp:Transcript_130007/g.259346  ORF Transcript_130007/g.259346 Transcript_130007/m.259346 type:complete len:555 (-) Transcript_130007:161-1825(-)
MFHPLLLFLLVQFCKLVSVWSVVLDTRSAHDKHGIRAEACAELINHGSHFGVEVEVGTPGQKFDVVADTGSNTFIIPSCQCMVSGACNKDDRCFIGTNRSSTFKLSQGPHGPMPMYLSFGSGSIAGVQAEDIVQVGQMKQYMQKGLMLMTNHALTFKSAFEGILGLGIPIAKVTPPANTDQRKKATAGVSSERIQEIIKKILGGGIKGVSGAGHLSNGNDAWPQAVARMLPNSPPGFLEQAGVDRFSMCFNDGRNGVLRLGPPRLENSHASVGVVHWGLGMSGISIGTSTVPLQICTASSMRKDQMTACGAIPDSGTTMITGPRAQLSVLFEAICDSWPRCKQNHTALMKAAEAAETAAKDAYGGVDPFGIKVGNSSKEIVLKLVLSDCTQWLSDGNGLGELPDLHFHITGASGTAQKLSLSAASYILETHRQQGPNGSSDKPSIQRVQATSINKMCMPAFQEMEYNTVMNGPVWILGTPFFYDYQVGYDMGTTPASVSFASVAESPCGSCNKKAGLVTSDVSTGAAATSQRVRWPRWLPGAPREPRIDVSQPL